MDLQMLKNALAGTAVAFRCITDYQPAGGLGDKIFPPTYEGGQYVMEERVNPKTGEKQQCVLLDSVQSQANRMELALLEEYRAGHIQIPLLLVSFDQPDLIRKFTVSSLEAPHRVADALFRDSLLNGKKFRASDEGRILDNADIRHATGLLEICPTALLFGLWDSHGPRGGMGVKFQRAIVSEIVGYDAVLGKKTASRIDPAQIRADAGPLYIRKEAKDNAPEWTLTKNSGKKLGKNGNPSAAGHSNIPPSIADGGCTISKARQTTTLSLAVLRRLRFPLKGAANSDNEVDLVARTALAALGLAAGTLIRSDSDLRSRCQLFAEQGPVWVLLDRPGEIPPKFSLTPEAAVDLAAQAIAEVKGVGLPWRGEINLKPSCELIELVCRSQKLETASSHKAA